MPPNRRPRRSTAEVQRLLLAAARRAFAEHGFGGATTSAVAESADVSERVLFRHFATKRRLYEAAVIEPFRVFLNDFADHWNELPVDQFGAEELFRRFAADLYGIVCDNRDMVSAFLHQADASALAPELQRLDAVAERFARAHNLTYDSPVSVRLLFLSIISAARYEGMLTYDRPDITRARIVHELGEIVLRHATWTPVRKDSVTTPSRARRGRV